jgi:hypothetical protein
MIVYFIKNLNSNQQIISQSSCSRRLRAAGLQRNFAAAHAALDTAKLLLRTELIQARRRYLLEPAAADGRYSSGATASTVKRQLDNRTRRAYTKVYA